MVSSKPNAAISSIVGASQCTNLRFRYRLADLVAVLCTSAQRGRPVPLTAGTTNPGLMPMVLDVNIDLIGREITGGGSCTQ